MKSATFVSMSPKVAKIGMVEDVGVVGVDVEVVEISTVEDTEVVTMMVAAVEVIEEDMMIVEEATTMVVSYEPLVSTSFHSFMAFKSIYVM